MAKKNNNTISRDEVLSYAVDVPMFGKMVKVVEVCKVKQCLPIQPDRTHEKWVCDYMTGDYFCSGCKRMTQDTHDEEMDYLGRKVIALCLPRYCGYCGARMDKEEESDEQDQT